MTDEHQEHGEFGTAFTPAAGEHPRPGDVIDDPSLGIAPEPIVGRDASTPLEEEPDHDIPASTLWALKDHRHVHWHLLPSHERHERLRLTVGEGTSEVSVIDDGARHAMVGRLVATAPGGVEYVLVGRVSRETAESDLADPFASAEELALVGVAVERDISSSNLFDVARYSSVADVPAGYLPGSPVQALAEPLEITAY
jgi:hypothetical protein